MIGELKAEPRPEVGGGRFELRFEGVLRLLNPSPNVRGAGFFFGVIEV
jgi:hypothetical protein